jgi:hypothetical protein
MPISKVQKPSSVLLGVLNTISGTIQTLSSLDLTGYRLIYCFFNGVSGSTTADLKLGNLVLATAVSPSARFRKPMFIELESGRELGVNTAFTTDIINTSTSITVSLTAGTFDEGQVKFYGLK